MKWHLLCTNESWEDWFSSEEDKVIAVFNIKYLGRIIKVGQLILPLIKKKFEYQIDATFKNKEVMQGTIKLQIRFIPFKGFESRISNTEIVKEFNVNIHPGDSLTINGDILLNEN